MDYNWNNRVQKNNTGTEAKMDDGAEIIPVVAGLLVSVAGLGILGYRIAGNWGALVGAVAGIVVGIAYNNLMSLIAKWGSLLALAGFIIYGAITSIL